MITVIIEFVWRSRRRQTHIVLLYWCKILHCILPCVLLVLLLLWLLCFSVIFRYVFGYLGTWLPFYFVMLALTCAALVYILILSVSELVIITLCVKVVTVVCEVSQWDSTVNSCVIHLSQQPCSMKPRHGLHTLTALSGLTQLSTFRGTEKWVFVWVSWRYGDGAGNTIEENSSVFCLIRMC